MDGKKEKKAQLPFRANIIFFIVFILFSILILQLGVVQILNGEAFQEEIDRTIQETTKISVPRGKMYDTNGNVIVDNKPLYSITYTPPKGVQAEDRLDLARKLSKYISMDREKDLKQITDRDKREYLYLKDLEKNKGKPESEREETFIDRLSEEELKDLSDSEVYQAVLDSITDEEIADDNFTKEELEVIRIKKELDKAYALTPQIIKNENVTPKEYALISEHLDELPGINATTDWDREYPYGSTIRMLLGNITTHQTGIPAENASYYMSRGYSRNDRVGTSGLEQQYEDILRGRKERIEYTTTKTGAVIDSEIVVEGQRGKDLILTIDMDFQEKVDQILREELGKMVRLDPRNNRFADDALAVAMNPKTGELLAVSGQNYNREKESYSDAAHKTLYDAHMPGSVIKGATILAGFESGAIEPGQTFYDRPIRIGGRVKQSLSKTIGLADDIKALRQSSNVYMFYVALRMGGYSLPGGGNIDTAVWQELRNYFGQFGLGTSTGIDYPYESIGVIGGEPVSPGILMDYSIGQFDTYTTLQLAQYVSTIANDGYRVRPHFVKEIREPIASLTEMGPIYRSNNTEYMNRIQMSEEEIGRVQEGFRQALQQPQGTAYRYFYDKSYNPAGKTGTAEVPIFENGVQYDTINRAIVAYAPMDNPEIAIAVIVPHIGLRAREDGNVANRIGERILDTYFGMHNGQSESEQEESDE